MSVFEPLPEREFDAYKAAHLLWRAGFGCTWDEAQAAAKAGLEKSVNALVDIPAAKNPAPAAAKLPEPSQPEFERSLKGMQETSRQEARRLRSGAERTKITQLKSWWLARMLASSPSNSDCRPLEEKMTLFWHSHFASSFEDKINFAYPMWRQNQTFREKALAPFPEVLSAVIRDPAMLVWLDNALSKKGRPNENFARELMELFSTGVNQYSEADVKEAARALTGWSVDRENWTFRFEDGAHDDAEKTFFGNTGNWSGDEIVAIICKQKCTAYFIAGKLIDFFLMHGAPSNWRAAATELYLSVRFDHREFLRVLFMSREFYSEQAMNAIVKSPVVLAIGALKQLRVTAPPETVLLDSLRTMGQDLYFPPDVNGWPGGAAWINSNTLLIRYNFANYLLNGVSPEAFTVYDPKTAPEGMRRREFVEQQRNAEAIEWSPRTQIVDAGLKNKLGSGRDIVEHYVREFLQRPISRQLSDQLNAFAETDASGGKRTFSVNDANFDERVRGLVHLIMSSPDYQLC